MKQYFTKYLPVGGKGDIGCKWQWKNNIKNTGWEDISRSDMDAISAHGLEPEPEFRKLKLYLCSRDIKVGDKVYEILSDKSIGDEFEWTSEIAKYNDSEPCFKVIGEISPEATWVKEGDEFDKDEIQEGWVTWKGGWTVPPRQQLTTKRKTFKIKGPCGHFH